MPKLTNTSLTGLDFDDIREELRNYLRNQSEFEDYDFEGSSISVLINALAYNTHYLAYYLNMVANEMFLDSAITRPSVVSAAKSLGYTPTSARAATAELDLTLTRNSESTSTIIEKYTPFNFTQSNTSYTFLVAEDATINTDTNTATVIVKEGTKFEFTYVFDDTNADQQLIIPNDNTDTSTLRVSVLDSPESTETTEYTLASDSSSLTGDSQVYFLTENQDGRFEIYFGDDTIGKKPTNGSAIQLEYIVTNGAEANGAGRKETTTPLFTIGTSIQGYSSVVASVSSPASGGSAKQSIDQIRFLAPLFYESQNRAVTIRDYESIVKQAYPVTESILIYGGEDANPPEYGKVFVAIKSTSGTTLSTRIKEEIKELIKEKNIVTVTPEVIDPDVLYCKIDTDVYYDPRLTSKSSGTILNNVVDKIEQFGDETLDKFNRSLFHSKLGTFIDETDTSIVHNATDISVYKRVELLLNTDASYTVNFNNEILHPNDGYSEPVITSDSFTHYDSITQKNVTAYLQDNGSGVIEMYRLVNGEKSVFLNNVGSVNYTTGVVSLTAIEPLTITSGETYIRLFAELKEEDVISSRNTILVIQPEDVQVNIFIREDGVNKPLAGY